MDFTKEPSNPWELFVGVFLMFFAVGLAIAAVFIVFVGLFKLCTIADDAIQSFKTKLEERKEKKN